MINTKRNKTWHTNSH